MAKCLTLLSFFALILVVLSTATTTAPSEKKNYTGYKVIRITQGSHEASHGSVGDEHAERLRLFQETASAVNTIAEAHLLDVWASNGIEGWMDVMIPPHLTSSISELFANMEYTTKIQDVQESIDENERSRIQSRNKADFFSDFQDYDTIVEWLKESAANHSDIATAYSIGKTNFSNDIWAIDLAPGQGKPVVIIHCGIHAREWITPSSCCWAIDRILNHDSVGRALLNTYNIIIFPSMNVDGYIYSHNTDRLWRKNRQANRGSTCVGTDLNRNYDFQWSRPGASGNPCAETYYGASAFSGTEAAVVRDLLDKHKANLISYWDIHAYSGLWMSPWGYTCQAYPPSYNEMRANMQPSAAAATAVYGHNYAFGAICGIIYQTSGGSIDYSYGVDGVVHSYSVEAHGNNFTPPPSWIPQIGQEIWVGVRTSIGLYNPPARAN